MTQKNTEQKTREIKIRVTPSDHEQITQNANRSGQSLTAYITNCVLKQMPALTPAQKTQLCKRLQMMTSENPDNISVTEGCREIYNIIQED